MIRRSSVAVLLVSLLAGTAAAQQAAAPPAAAPQAPPVVTAGPGGFEIRSADSSFRLRIRGFVHGDVRAYPADDDARGIDAFVLRRARPIFEATVHRIVDIRIMPDFGGGTATLQDAYLDVHASKAFNLRAGKQKAPVGQERLVSITDVLFVERALPSALVPNRDVGIQAYGDLAPWLAYNAGVFNGVADGASGDTDTTDSKDVVGRVAVSPFKGTSRKGLQLLTFGAAGSTGKETGTVAAPALAQIRSGGQLAWFRYRTDGTAANTTIADGRRTRAVAFGQYYSGPLGLLAEYIRSRQVVRRAAAAAAVAQRAWQITGSWVLTGETSTGRSVQPRAVFDPAKGTWGAFEIAARVNRLTVDDAAFPVFASLDASARQATAAGVGVNWYLNRNLKIAADYERTRFERGAPEGADRSDEHALFTRFQVAF